MVKALAWFQNRAQGQGRSERNAPFGPGSRRRPLFVTYAMAIAGMACGVVVLGGLAEMWFSYHEASRILAELQRERASAAAQTIDHFVQDLERQLRWVTPAARSDGLQGLIDRRNDYHRLLSQLESVSGVRYFDASGREQISVSRLGLDAIARGTDSESPLPPKATSQTASFGPVLFEGGSEPVVHVAIRESGADGGTVVADVNLRFVDDIVCCAHGSRNQQTYVVDERGRVIAHSEISSVQRRSGASIARGVVLPSVERALEFLARSSSRQGPTVELDDSNSAVVAVSVRIEPTGWHVVVQQPLVDVVQPIIAIVGRIVVLLILVLAVALALSLYVGRRLAAPIEAIEHGAARMEAGALEGRIEVRTGDQIEDLAEQFNRMAARLRASYSGLEDLVHERTRNLATALEEIRGKGAQLERASLAKSEFLAHMSHELRSPLTSIVGFAELIARDQSGEHVENRARHTQKIVSAAMHILEIINETLALARAEAGKAELGISRFGLLGMLESAVSILEGSASRRQITLKLSVAPGLTDIEADERKVKQIVLNLGSNAIKFTPVGGCVEFAGCFNGDTIEISVRDSGVGIAPEHLDRIFEPYEQVAGEANHGGTGLGLALSKQFAELHRGRLTVRSEVGVGSTFTLVLPRIQSAADPAHDAADGRAEGGPPDQLAPTPIRADRMAAAALRQHEEREQRGVEALSRRRLPVLVVEDDKLVADVIQAALGSEGYHVVHAETGIEGLVLARTERLGLVILDIHLPGADGFSVIQQLRSDPVTATVPIVVVTGKPLSDAERAWLGGHIDHLAQKGQFPLSELTEIVHRLLPASAA